MNKLHSPAMYMVLSGIGGQKRRVVRYILFSSNFCCC